MFANSQNRHGEVKKFISNSFLFLHSENKKLWLHNHKSAEKIVLPRILSSCSLFSAAAAACSPPSAASNSARRSLPSRTRMGPGLPTAGTMGDGMEYEEGGYSALKKKNDEGGDACRAGGGAPKLPPLTLNRPLVTSRDGLMGLGRP